MTGASAAMVLLDIIARANAVGLVGNHAAATMGRPLISEPHCVAFKFTDFISIFLAQSQLLCYLFLYPDRVINNTPRII